MLTYNDLKERLHYNPDTGVFRNRITRCHSAKEGEETGYLTNTGYISINILGKNYPAHHLAWFYMKGEFPPEIDHINHNRSDNSFANLRIVTRAENQKNRTINANNKMGVMGVSQAGKKWTAGIGVNGKFKHLGTYSSLFDAICARKSAEIVYGFHENHGGAPAS